MTRYLRNSPFLLIASILPALFLAGCPGTPPSDSTTGQTSVSGTEITTAHSLVTTPGLYLAYTVNNPRAAALAGDDTAHILVANTTGSRIEVLLTFPGFIFHTVPSPTGTHVAFVGSVRISAANEERHIFIYDISTGKYKDVSEGGFYTRKVTTAPVFTPDGSAAIFISKRADDYPVYNIFSCDIESGRTSGLYTEPVEDVPLDLMPDGERIIAVRKIPDRPGTQEFFAINTRSGESSTLYRFENVTKLGPGIVSSDGKMIFCDLKPSEEGTTMGVGARSRELWAVNLDENSSSMLLDPMTVTYVYQVYRDALGNERLLLRRQEDMEGEDTPMSRIASCLPDGSDFQYITDTSARSYLFGPPPKNTRHVSPDNSLIFFYRQDPVFSFEDIWIMVPDGSNPVNISNTAGYAEGSAGWLTIPDNPF